MKTYKFHNIVQLKHGLIKNFANITFEQKQKKLKQQLFENNIKYEKDLILLQGADDKIDEICEICNFDRKTGLKFATEIANINKNDNNNNNQETLLVLDQNEMKKYLILNQKINNTINIINNINNIIENKNETTNTLINTIVNKMKLKNDEYFENMIKYKEICENNLKMLNQLKNQIIIYNQKQDQQQNQKQNKPFNIIDEIEKTLMKLNTTEEPKNILNHILLFLNNEKEVLDEKENEITQMKNMIYKKEKIIDEKNKKNNKFRKN